VSMAIFVLGGEVLSDFSLALLVGVVIGTYSSIFIASPLLLMLQGGKSKLLGSSSDMRKSPQRAKSA